MQTPLPTIKRAALSLMAAALPIFAQAAEREVNVRTGSLEFGRASLSMSVMTTRVDPTSNWYRQPAMCMRDRVQSICVLLSRESILKMRAALDATAVEMERPIEPDQPTPAAVPAAPSASGR